MNIQKNMKNCLSEFNKYLVYTILCVYGLLLYISFSLIFSIYYPDLYFITYLFIIPFLIIIIIQRKIINLRFKCWFGGRTTTKAIALIYHTIIALNIFIVILMLFIIHLTKDIWDVFVHMLPLLFVLNVIFFVMYYFVKRRLQTLSRKIQKLFKNKGVEIENILTSELATLNLKYVEESKKHFGISTKSYYLSDWDLKINVFSSKKIIGITFDLVSKNNYQIVQDIQRYLDIKL